MTTRKQVVFQLPAALVRDLDEAARDRCVGRGLLVEMLLTQGLRQLMPADSYLFGVEVGELPEPDGEGT